MKVGAAFPQKTAVAEPHRMAEFLGEVEEFGFDYISFLEDVAGAPPDRTSGSSAIPCTCKTASLDVLTAVAYAAAVTSHLGLSAGMLVLPHRETFLAAKQLATIHTLSQGRFRLGLGVAWSHTEQEALQGPFGDWSRVATEQSDTLHRLMVELGSGSGNGCCQSDGVGLDSKPVSPIPLWFGGGSARALARIARWGEGWIPPRFDPATGEAPDLDPLLRELDEQLELHGRSRAELGIEGWVRWEGPGSIAPQLETWQAVDATCVLVMAAGERMDDHLKALSGALNEFD